jgi:hypothetical protein
MRRQHPRECGICGQGTPTLSGALQVWPYEPRDDFYCADHWEDAFLEDRQDHLDDGHWEMVTLPLLELTRDGIRRATRVPVLSR